LGQLASITRKWNAKANGRFDCIIVPLITGRKGWGDKHDLARALSPRALTLKKKENLKIFLSSVNGPTKLKGNNKKNLVQQSKKTKNRRELLF